MASKGVTWDAANDRKLFLGIIKSHNISVDYEAMAAYMTTEDQNCTAEAVKSRIKKLKAMAKDVAIGAGEDTPTPKTKGRKRDASEHADEITPSKKAKTTKKQSGRERKAAQVEAEDGNDDEMGGVSVKEEDGDQD